MRRLTSELRLPTQVIHNCHKGKAHTSFPFDNIREIEESQTQVRVVCVGVDPMYCALTTQ